MLLANPVLFDKPLEHIPGKLGFFNYDLPEDYATL
jgi:hypothetical protein